MFLRVLIIRGMEWIIKIAKPVYGISAKKKRSQTLFLPILSKTVSTLRIACFRNSYINNVNG